MIIIMMMMAVVIGLDDLEKKRGDQMNMAMVNNCGIQYFSYWLLIFM